MAPIGRSTFSELISNRPEPGVVGILLLTAGITARLYWQDPAPAPALRHAYLIPALWAALRFGCAGAALVSLLTVLLYAPLVLPALEEGGLTRENLEGLLSLGWLGGIGPLVGALASQARARARRYDALLALQRILASGAPLSRLLAGVAEQARESLSAHAVTLAVAVGEGNLEIVRCGERETVSTAALGLREGSLAAWVWSQRESLFIADVESDPRLGGDGLASARPRRAAVVPLRGQAELVGVLVLERLGEISRGERTAMDTLGLQLGLGLENARLTERQRRFSEELEEKVATATRRLRELDQAKSDFVSIVSHELRTPLTSIRGFSELLLARAVPLDRQRQFLGYILHESERLGRIVEDLLDLSRIEAGAGRRLDPAPLDLGPLLERNAELFGCQSAIHEVRAECGRDLPPVLADRDAVDCVLKNLLSNAIKYSPRGGLVRMRAARAAADPGLVEVSVEDEGLGIPPEAIGRVFDKYYRVSRPEAAHVRGLGIGLALVKSLVEAHGGTVRATSTPGRGSCFRLTLPLA